MLYERCFKLKLILDNELEVYKIKFNKLIRYV